MFYIFSFTAELIKLYLLQRLAGYNKTKRIILPCCMVIVSFIAIWLLQDILSSYDMIIFVTFIPVVSIALFIKGRNKIVFILLGTVILWFIDIFFLNMLTVLLPESLTPYTDFASLIILATIFFACRYFKKLPLIKFESLETKQVLFFMVGVVSYALYLTPSQIDWTQIDLYQLDNPSRISGFFTIFSSLSGIFLIIILIHAWQKNEYKITAQMTETLRKYQEQYFQLLLSKEVETKEFRHDFSNHLFNIEYLLENGKTVELKKYLNDMSHAAANLKPEIQTGSDVINATICMLRERYKHIGYIIQWNGYFHNDVKLAPIDLSSIFYNLLENAIEAVDKLPNDEDKIISVIISHKNNMLYFSIKNPVTGESKKLTKGNGLERGNGLNIVARIVDNSDGKFKYTMDENEFTVEVSFFDL